MPWPREVAGPLHRLFRLNLQHNAGWKIGEVRQLTAFGKAKNKEFKAKAVRMAMELCLVFVAKGPEVRRRSCLMLGMIDKSQ